MGEGLANCRYFFFLVSKSSLSSQMVGFQKNVSLNNGETWNAFQISRSEATSLGFPFVVKLSASKDARISLKYTMRAVTIDSFKAVPLINNLPNTTKEIPPN